jgi:ERCC4-related helicase
MAAITHPCIKPGSLESREYQISIAMRALDGNTLVVLPTGLGKTAIALLVAASRLYNEKGKVLMLAPTKPLVEQHLRFFEKHLVIGGEQPVVALFTGDSPPGERKKEFSASTLIFATPQVVKNDLLAGAYALDDVSLLVVDECHRAVGNYAYVFVARKYMETARSPLILAMTASPGGREEKVTEVCTNLSIDIIESRTDQDPDVSPYIHQREIEVIEIGLPVPLRQAVDELNQLLDSRLRQLKELGFDAPRRQELSMKSLSLLNARVQEMIHQGDAAGYAGASLYAEVMKLRHAVTLAESQGSKVLAGYLARLSAEGLSPGGSKAAARLARDQVFVRLLERSRSWTEELHPKLSVMAGIVRHQQREFPDSRIIVFASYRDMVQQIVDFLQELGIPATRFVGQAARDREKGLSQKEQVDILHRFRGGEFGVLVATSVGEEGLDVPSTDMVIFYEAVPSEIRSIQRKGRTGRSGAGKIVVLVTKGTSDETFRFVSQSRERSMASGIKSLGARIERQSGGTPSGSQALISSFPEEGPDILVDDRETQSKVVEHLSTLGARISIERLSSGDYQVGDRVVVERKSARDFVDSLVERDLFGQLSALAAHALRPVLIIEGGDIYTQRDVNQNALRGTLAAITVDMGIALLFTRDEEDTARMLLVISRRESERGEKGARVPVRKSFASAREEQEAVIASFPEVGLKNARQLLAHFGSIRAITDATEEELAGVPGIGKKKAQRIAGISQKKYD